MTECMERDGYRCVRCGVLLANVWAGYSCHHRQSKSVGPDSLENRIMLCGSGSSPHCHQYVHAHPAESREKGWIISKYIKRDELPRMPCWHFLLGMVYYDREGGIHVGTWDGPTTSVLDSQVRGKGEHHEHSRHHRLGRVRSVGHEDRIPEGPPVRGPDPRSDARLRRRDRHRVLPQEQDAVARAAHGAGDGHPGP